MDVIKGDLLRIFDMLEDDDFTSFKWYLRDPPSPEDFRAIPACPLENADRRKTVDLMVRYHGSDSVDLAKEILEKIPRMDLIEEFDSSGDEEEEEVKEQ
ncbi:NACHT, LRR and PYD domains-containing protein 3-like [Gasterosteus aculeatus]